VFANNTRIGGLGFFLGKREYPETNTKNNCKNILRRIYFTPAWGGVNFLFARDNVDSTKKTQPS
jgi:hypothetical protein